MNKHPFIKFYVEDAGNWGGSSDDTPTRTCNCDPDMTGGRTTCPIHGHSSHSEDGWRDAFVRDVCSVVPKSKSEVRIRLDELLASTEERVRTETLKEVRRIFDSYQGREDLAVSEIRAMLSSLTTPKGDK